MSKASPFHCLYSPSDYFDAGYDYKRHVCMFVCFFLLQCPLLPLVGQKVLDMFFSDHSGTIEYLLRTIIASLKANPKVIK